MNEPTVLVVDDETAIRDMLRMALEIADFRCIEADNIHDAYTLVVDERPAGEEQPSEGCSSNHGLYRSN